MVGIVPDSAFTRALTTQLSSDYPDFAGTFKYVMLVNIHVFFIMYIRRDTHTAARVW